MLFIRSRQDSHKAALAAFNQDTELVETILSLGSFLYKKYQLSKFPLFSDIYQSWLLNFCMYTACISCPSQHKIKYLLAILLMICVKQ